MTHELRSMTGYGRGESTDPDGTTIIAEIKSVNHRFLEIVPRTPRSWMAVESLIKDKVKEAASRGKVDVVITVNAAGVETKKPVVSEALVREYIRIGEKLGSEFGIESRLTISEILRLPEVLAFPNEVPDAEKLWTWLLPAMNAALEQFMASRAREGLVLAADLAQRNEFLRNLVEEIEGLHQGSTKILSEKLKKRISDLLEGAGLDETRIAQEAAHLADKEDISEELVRLKCHIDQFTRTIQSPPPVGKELDFLLQEMLRETNTSCAKVSDVEIIHRMLRAKNEVEKMREQIQNLE